MKQIFTNCDLNLGPTPKYVTALEKVIFLEQILLIVNLTRGVIYYNFASGPRITRQTLPAPALAPASTRIFFDTSVDFTGHDTNDKIIIFYDDLAQAGEAYLMPKDGTAVSTDGASQAGVGVSIGFNDGEQFLVVSENAGLPVNVKNELTVANVKDGDGNTFGIDRNFPVEVQNNVGVSVVSAIQDGDGTTFGIDRNFPVEVQNEIVVSALRDGDGSIFGIDRTFPVELNNDVRLTQNPNSGLAEASSDYIKVSGFPVEFNVFNGIYQRTNVTPPSSTSSGANLVSYTNISAVGLGGEFVPRLDYTVIAQAWPPDPTTPVARKWFFSAEETMAEKVYPVSNWTIEENAASWLGSVSPIGLTGWTSNNSFYPGNFSNISITSHAPITTRDPALGSRWEGISGSDIPSQNNQPPTVLGLLQRICFRFTQIFGNPNTSASSSDTDINATIISLFKRLLQRITTLVAPVGSRITGMGSSASRVLVEEVDKAGANYRTIQITAGPRYTGIFRSVSPGGQGWIESGDGFFYNMLGSDGSDGWDVVLQYGTGTGFSGSRWHLYDNARALPVFWANNNTASLPLVISTSGWTRNTTFIPSTEPLSVSPVVAQPVVIQPQAYNNPIPVIETNQKGSTVSNGTFTSTSSLSVVGNNFNRKLCTIFNEGPGNLFVLYGSGTASPSNYSVRLAPRDYLEVDKFTGQITAVFDLSGSTARTTSIS